MLKDETIPMMVVEAYTRVFFESTIRLVCEILWPQQNNIGEGGGALGFYGLPVALQGGMGVGAGFLRSIRALEDEKKIEEEYWSSGTGPRIFRGLLQQRLRRVGSCALEKKNRR